MGSSGPYERFHLPRQQLGISSCCDEQVLEILEVCRRELLATGTQCQLGKIPPRPAFGITEGGCDCRGLFWTQGARNA